MNIVPCSSYLWYLISNFVKLWLIPIINQLICTNVIFDEIAGYTSNWITVEIISCSMLLDDDEDWFYYII